MPLFLNSLAWTLVISEHDISMTKQGCQEKTIRNNTDWQTYAGKNKGSDEKD